MLLEKKVHQLALFLVQKNILREEDMQWGEYLMLKRIMGYGVFCILFGIGTCLAGIIESFCFICNFMFLRKRAGGYHATTPLQCLMLSIVVEISVCGLIFLVEKIQIANAVMADILFIISGLIVMFVYPKRYSQYGMNDEEWKTNKSIVRKWVMIEFIIYFLINSMGNNIHVWKMCKGYYIASLVTVAIFIIISKYPEEVTE